ncbi:MAG: acetylxylan esterase, partial [Turicibacter sp.]
CEFYEFKFIGMDGSTRYAKYIKPKSKEPVGAILQFHGYPGSSRSFFEQLSHVGMGFAVIALDCGGQGGKSQDLGNYTGTTVSGHIVMGLDGEPKDMYYVKLFQDLCLLCRIVTQLDEIDATKIYANGASQGAALALVCTALNPTIKKCAALYPFLSDYKRVWEMDLDVVAYEGLRYYMKWFDPMHEKVDEIFTKLGYIDVKNFAPKVKADVLFGTGLIDNICPPSTQFAVFNAFNGPKKHMLFPDYTHEEIFAFDDLLIDFFGTGQQIKSKEVI